MSAEEAKKRGLTPLARIKSRGRPPAVDPALMGTGPIPASKQGAGEGRLERRRSRSGRSQRGLRGAGDLGQPRSRLGHLQGQRQRRRHLDRSSDRRLGGPRSRHPAARDAEARCQERPRDAVHRRRHGHRPLRRALIPHPHASPVSRASRRRGAGLPTARGPQRSPSPICRPEDRGIHVSNVFSSITAPQR